jgi:hypothetical protein
VEHEDREPAEIGSLREVGPEDHTEDVTGDAETNDPGSGERTYTLYILTCGPVTAREFYG